MKLNIPADGVKIGYDGKRLIVPDNPIIPYIIGDGIGIDVTPVMKRVLDYAVNKAYRINKNLALLIIFGSIPLIVFGFVLHASNLIYYLRNIEIIAWTTLIFGILLYFSDRFKIKKSFDNDLNLKNILIIGLFQILALIPGVSRSGIVITASRFLNFDRYDSLKISFYLSIPALAGASVLGLKDAFNQNIEFSFLIVFATISSFIISYLTIKYFLIFVKNFSLNVFVFYRIFLALILFVIVYY